MHGEVQLFAEVQLHQPEYAIVLRNYRLVYLVCIHAGPDDW